MKDYSTPAEGILKREADGTIASQEVVEVELVDLAAVATSGNYNDLTNKPTIPANTDTLGKNIVGTSATASSNGAVSGIDGVYLNHIEGTNTVKSTHKIVGSGATTVKSDADGNITINTPAAPVTSVNSKTGAVELSASDVGAQPTITANGFLKGDGSGKITADNPLFVVNFTWNSTAKTYTSDATAKEIYDAYSANYSIIGKHNNNICYLSACKISTNSKYDIIFTGEYLPQGPAIVASGFFRMMELIYITYAEGNTTTFTQGISQQVPSTRTINGKALTSNISLNAADVGAQPTITANGFLKGNGSGNITTDKPLFIVNFSDSGNTRTSNKTVKQIYDAHTAGYNVVGFSDNNIIQLIQCLQLPSKLYNIVFNGPDYNVDSIQGVNYHLQTLEVVEAQDDNTTFDFWQFTSIPNTQKINGQALDGDITLNASDVNAVGLTGDQTITGMKTFSGKATFKSTVDFTNATVTGLMTAAVGTTTDYSIYIGSTAPAANTAPLLWIDTSASGVMKYRTSTSSTTWTAVPVAWG